MTPLRSSFSVIVVLVKLVFYPSCFSYFFYCILTCHSHYCIITCFDYYLFHSHIFLINCCIITYFYYYLLPHHSSVIVTSCMHHRFSFVAAHKLIFGKLKWSHPLSIHTHTKDLHVIHILWVAFGYNFCNQGSSKIMSVIYYLWTAQGYLANAVFKGKYLFIIILEV